MARLPADGSYCVHLGDTARKGGEEYGYRLRISAPEPDFALRVVPSSTALRPKGSTTVNVHLQRKDGFAGPIKLSLKNPPPGFTNFAVSIVGTQTVAKFTFKTDLPATNQPYYLTIVGTAKIVDREVTHDVVPAEDRMQAFLWRHLVPARDFPVLIMDPNYQPIAKRIRRARPATEPASISALATNQLASTSGTNTNSAPEKPKFSKQQVAGRLRQLKLLFEEGLLTDEFYEVKVAECEAAQ
jgi:hypothetical protein